MIVDALLSADKHMHIAEQIYDPAKFLYLTDSIIEKVAMSDDPVCCFTCTLTVTDH